MAKIGELYIELGARVDKLEREMNKAKGILNSTRGPADQLTTKFGALAKSMPAIGSAYIGMQGIKNLASSFMDAAKTSEGFKIRLTGLLGSVQEGNRLFQSMAEYAGKVPFQYEEIMEAATRLAGVMKGGADEIAEWMPLIGDLAAATGMSLNDVVGQVIRMYSAGAASADMFRERGVLAMLGFKAGVKYSVDETKEIMMNAWKDPESQFRGMTENLANTWDGMTSMLKDAWFQFRNAVMEAGVYDYLKDELKKVLDKVIELAESGKLQEWAEGAATAIMGLIEATKEFFDLVTSGKPAVMAMGEGLAEWIMNLMGLESPQQKMNQLQSEAIQKAIGFKNSLQVLKPSMEDIRVEFEKGKEHADAWMQSMKDQDTRLSANKDQYIELSKQIFEAVGLIDDHKDSNEELDPTIKKVKVSTELLTTAIKTQNRELKLVFETLDKTLIPKYREWPDIVYNTQSEIKSHVFNANEDIVEDVKTTTKTIENKWQEVADGIRTNWTENLSDVLQGTKSLKDGLKDIFNHIKDMFFDMVAQMVTKWIFGFAQKLITSTIESTTSVASQLTSTATNLISQVGQWSPGGIVGSVISGAISGLFSGLLGGQGVSKQTGQDQLHELRSIKTLTEQTQQHELHWMDEKLAAIADYTGARIPEKLDAIINVLRKIKKNVGGFQHEGIVTRPQLAMVGERGPEAIVRLDKFARGESKFSGAFGGASVTVNYSPHITAMDAQDVHRFMETKGRDALEQMIRANVRGITREIREQIGKY